MSIKNIKINKLIKYYSLINFDLIYSNKAINRYKKNNNYNDSNQSKDLKDLERLIANVKNCELKKNATNLVFADGNLESNIMIVGEGPGANEDKEGLPFVGRAGQLLDKMLESINLDRKNVYITNVVNYRPPQNRKPTDKEILKYLPFLKRHIEIISPKILILLGSTALNSIIGNKEVISKARGKWNKLKIGKSSPFVIASFHPAFLMRQPEQKKMAWTDLKMIRKKILELGIKIDK
tara:strand:+ start:7583 stop:8293 length:711 start_codon:yes stop_codon:yes gene_type:complete